MTLEQAKANLISVAEVWEDDPEHLLGADQTAYRRRAREAIDVLINAAVVETLVAIEDQLRQHALGILEYANKTGEMRERGNGEGHEAAADWCAAQRAKIQGAAREATP